MAFTLTATRVAFEKLALLIEEKKEYLTDLDSAIGDADHGINMNRGFKKVMEKFQGKEYSDLNEIFRDVAMTLMSAVGGSAGPLYGTFFMKTGQALAGKKEATAEEFADALQEGLDATMKLGKSVLGDKTMVDAISPAIEALRSKPGDERAAWIAAADAAEDGMKATIPMLAKRGRSSYLGERSIGHQDPGATSSWYLFSCFKDALEGK